MVALRVLRRIQQRHSPVFPGSGYGFKFINSNIFLFSNIFYKRRIKPPATDSDQCVIHIESYGESETKVFDATLSLRRKPLIQSQLNRVLLKTPAQTASVAIGIYWQALKLFLKRIPFYKHPGKSQTKIEKGTL